MTEHSLDDVAAVIVEARPSPFTCNRPRHANQGRPGLLHIVWSDGVHGDVCPSCNRVEHGIARQLLAAAR